MNSHHVGGRTYYAYEAIKVEERRRMGREVQGELRARTPFGQKKKGANPVSLMRFIL